jgi:hypothetical protein
MKDLPIKTPMLKIIFPRIFGRKLALTLRTPIHCELMRGTPKRRIPTVRTTAPLPSRRSNPDPNVMSVFSHASSGKVVSLRSR